MPKGMQAASPCLFAEQITLVRLLVICVVESSVARSTYFKYASLRYSPSPSKSRKPASLGFSCFGKVMVRACGVVVGKVVTSLGRNFGLCTTSTTRSLIVTKNVFIMHSLVTFSKQPLIVYTQLFLGYFKELGAGFYTLTTGPTNTTKLNKGIIL